MNKIYVFMGGNKKKSLLLNTLNVLFPGWSFRH